MKRDALGRVVPGVIGKPSDVDINRYKPEDFHDRGTAQQAYTDLLREHGHTAEDAARIAGPAAEKTQDSLGAVHSDGRRPTGNTGRPARDVDLITPWAWSDRARIEGGT